MTRAWLFAAAAAALLVMAPGLADPYQAPRLIALGAVAFLLCARSSRHGSNLEVPLIVGLFCWTIALYFSQDRTYSMVGQYLQPFDGFTAVIVYIGLTIGVARLGAGVEDAADAVCWASVPLSLYAIAQRFITDPTLPAQLPGHLRVAGTQGSPVYLGIVLAIVVAVAAARRNWVAMGLGSVALLLTQTRGAILGAAVGCFLLLPRRARWVAAVAGLGAVLSHRSGVVASDLGRIEIWRGAWGIFLAHPLAGTGPATFGQAFRSHISAAYIAAHGSALASADHAHNELLQVLATTGLVGLTGYLALAATMALMAFDEPILLAAGVAYLIPAMLNPAPSAAVALLAILFGAASSVSVVKERREWFYLAPLLASLVVCCRISAADWHYARAVHAKDAFTRAEQMNRAAQLNPWEIQITAKQIETVMAVSPTPNVAQACVSIAGELLKRHPMDSFAHEIMGRTELAAYMIGAPAVPEDALAQFDEAIRLAPTFTPLLMRQRALAAALGRGEQARQAGQEIARLSNIARGGA